MLWPAREVSCSEIASYLRNSIKLLAGRSSALNNIEPVAQVIGLASGPIDFRSYSERDVPGQKIEVGNLDEASATLAVENVLEGTDYPLLCPILPEGDGLQYNFIEHNRVEPDTLIEELGKNTRNQTG